MMIFLQVVAGFLGGILGGMGMGGGTLLIPILAIFLQMEQRLCQGINLLTFLVMALVSLVIHFRHNLVEISIVFPLVLGGLIFSVFGAMVAGVVPNEKLKVIWGVFLLILGVFQLFCTFLKSEEPKRKKN